MAGREDTRRDPGWWHPILHYILETILYQVELSPSRTWPRHGILAGQHFGGKEDQRDRMCRGRLGTYRG